MRNINIYRYLVITMFFIVLLVGSFVGCKYVIKNTNKNDNVEEVVYVVNNDDNEDQNVNIYEEKLVDVKVLYEDYYTLCGQTIRSEDIYYSTNVEKVKEAELNKQNEEKKEYSIVHEDEENIVFKRTINTNCPNHFTIKLEEDEIIVYYKVNEKELEVYKKINIASELIREELKERLKEGIDVDSKEELNLIIEDIES